MLHAKDPSSTYCRRCSTELIWEHPKGSGHCQTSSDYVGGDICRSCLDELRANSAGTADSMTDDATLVPITLFQAPLAVLQSSLHRACPLPVLHAGFSREPGVPWDIAPRT